MKLVALQLAGLIVVAFSGASAAAAPLITVSHLGVNLAGNREWSVSIAPDPNLFTQGSQGFGGVVSTEIALEVDGAELISVSKSAVDWPLNTPGNNPFTGGVSVGLAVDLVNDRAFAALTSRFLTSGQSTSLLQIETAGSGAAAFSWGGHSLLVGTPFSYIGSRISQGGVNFDGRRGLVSVPAASADFDGGGIVDGNDFLTWQRGLRVDGLGVRASGDADSDGMIDGVDIRFWKSQFGSAGAAQSSVATQLAVPEPNSCVLIALGAIFIRRRLPVGLHSSQQS